MEGLEKWVMLTDDRIYKATDLNLVLVQLVEYLGHSSPFITGVALNEVGKLFPHGFSILKWSLARRNRPRP